MIRLTGFFFICVLLSACGLTGGETTAPAAGIYVVNASPDAPAIDVSLNNNVIANTFGYGKDSGYFLTYPGTYPLKVSQSNTATVFVDNFVSFGAGKYYSLFLVDSFAQRQLLFFEDDLSIDSVQKAGVRFFNLSPNSPDSVYVIFYNTATTDSLKYKNRKFNDQAASVTFRRFSSVPAGSYNLDLYTRDTLPIQKLGSMSFAAGKFYTIYLKGFYQSTTTPLDKGVIEHN